MHFKNDNIKGPQTIPLAPGTVAVMALLEQAAAFMRRRLPGVSTLFFSHWTGLTFQSSWFCTLAGDLLTMHGARHTAGTFRHFFATTWRDFISNPTTQLMGLTAHQLETVAASMMLTSPTQWSLSYDGSTVARGMQTVLQYWPSFLTFLLHSHLDKVTEQEWDPLTATLPQLGL